jgi:hypothetical protein
MWTIADGHRVLTLMGPLLSHRTAEAGYLSLGSEVSSLSGGRQRERAKCSLRRTESIYRLQHLVAVTRIERVTRGL